MASSLHTVAEFDIANGHGKKCDHNHYPQHILHKSSNSSAYSRDFLADFLCASSPALYRRRILPLFKGRGGSAVISTRGLVRDFRESCESLHRKYSRNPHPANAISMKIKRPAICPPSGELSCGVNSLLFEQAERKGGLKGS